MDAKPADMNLARRTPWLWLALSLWGGPAMAQATLSLDAVWQAALQHDKALAVARAERSASQTHDEQAKALWRPTATLSMGAGVGAYDSRITGAQFSAPAMGTMRRAEFANSVHHGDARRATLQASLPLLNPGRRAEQKQLQLSAEHGELQWQAAQLAAQVNAAESYYGLALAEERVRVTRLQREAVARASQEADERFALGAVAITDTYEASALLASIDANLAALELETQLKRQTLSDLTGLTSVHVAPLGTANTAGRDPLPGMEQCLRRAQEDNPQLRLQSLAVELARQGIAKHAPHSGVSLDLVAQAAHEQLSGQGDFGQASQKSTQQMIGLQLTIPLYTGGMRSARQDEAVALQQRAQAQLAQLSEQIATRTRHLWLSLQTDQYRLNALEQAVKASHARLEATRLGQQLGERSTLDVLNAENELASKTLQLAEARVNHLLDRLRLRATQGELPLGGE